MNEWVFIRGYTDCKQKNPFTGLKAHWVKQSRHSGQSKEANHCWNHLSVGLMVGKKWSLDVSLRCSLSQTGSCWWNKSNLAFLIRKRWWMKLLKSYWLSWFIKDFILASMFSFPILAHRHANLTWIGTIPHSFSKFHLEIVLLLLVTRRRNLKLTCCAGLPKYSLHYYSSDSRHPKLDTHIKLWVSLSFQKC